MGTYHIITYCFFIFFLFLTALELLYLNDFNRILYEYKCIKCLYLIHNNNGKEELIQGMDGLRGLSVRKEPWFIRPLLSKLQHTVSILFF